MFFFIQPGKVPVYAKLRVMALFQDTRVIPVVDILLVWAFLHMYMYM